jgi:hypothetical protein
MKDETFSEMRMGNTIVWFLASSDNKFYINNYGEYSSVVFFPPAFLIPYLACIRCLYEVFLWRKRLPCVIISECFMCAHYALSLLLDFLSHFVEYVDYSVTCNILWNFPWMNILCQSCLNSVLGTAIFFSLQNSTSISPLAFSFPRPCCLHLFVLILLSSNLSLCWDCVSHSHLSECLIFHFLLGFL